MPERTPRITFEITDSKGRSRKFLDWRTAAAFAVGLITVHTENGSTFQIDPNTIGGIK
ncbi:hypothetical protein [Streptomyces malaysiensis]|uniref:Uncharacterized protein n=1 Tax=Streptomyces malaysiensis TaxID=92644 RepID=A0A7X5X7P2_STRMQ|nr:hypothetical protein [Streptomyces malaysiensis]NIY68087.1 hypothetical protein [Streptomyces malaysiensis]